MCACPAASEDEIVPHADVVFRIAGFTRRNDVHVPGVFVANRVLQRAVYVSVVAQVRHALRVHGHGMPLAGLRIEIHRARHPHAIHERGVFEMHVEIVRILDFSLYQARCGVPSGETPTEQEY